MRSCRCGSSSGPRPHGASATHSPSKCHRPTVGRIVKTLKFVRDEVIPSVGEVETLSAYRNGELNACSNGAPKSAHREFFALDVTPVNQRLERSTMIRSVCRAHARDGQTYDVGLGFYTGRRFHVDSSSFRKWGRNGKGATSLARTTSDLMGTSLYQGVTEPSL